ncbi:HZS-alpha domain-containing protein [Sulfidibacter corallicola]|uniref:Hydrazine synthase alpha subunit middle domain-containing protein n=1 Tax=Sulfidibacter corallicola TaxID=2818388 RepID=A0A8A4TS20_SULCO|nr:hypothetical protein [Sulfidibacter corallicola]QTD51828.1 hypothetical protein J3U87_05100 [Sulfidibacter corallicola]
MFRFSMLCLLAFFAVNAGAGTSSEPSSERKRGGLSLENPILFVTQVPIPADFTTIGSTFGNHLARLAVAGRGGDLYIRYPDGTLKNLTQAAGFGQDGHQGESAIGVRDPHVHWDGQKALFSMTVGAPEQFEVQEYYWQLYEITGLGPDDTPVITKVPNQPDRYNNIQPIYGLDDDIIFVSDRPRDGLRHLYPLLDEYEEAPTPTGLWRLDPANGNLHLMNHTPSGAFYPFIDSDGRVVFTRWDHLQRDQQADADETSDDGPVYGTFNYADESENAARLDNREEFFPEPRRARTDLLEGTNLEGHSFNRFFIWQINTDGTAEEVLNHLGRHEMVGYFNRVFNDDGSLREFISSVSGRFNTNDIRNLFRAREDPTRPGTFFAVDAPEFQSHTSGQVVSFHAPAGHNPDQTGFDYVTHRDTANVSDTPSPDHSGLYRDVAPLNDGQVLVVHTAETRADRNDGTRAQPTSRYDYRIKVLAPTGQHMAAGQPITAGIDKTLSYYDPDVLVSYSGPMWELSPVEVVARVKPQAHTDPVPDIESRVIDEEGVDLDALRQWMRDRDLALVVSRDVTTRDANDRQQPFNLQISGSQTQTLGDDGPVYDLKYLQFFQADRIRGIGGLDSPRAGRRVLAQPMHDTSDANPANASGPAGSVVLGSDGSMAAFVPARRAMSWQLTDDGGVPVVRERYWVTFQPGEVRVCASCHGVNTTDQAGNPPPENEPLALRDLLDHWKSTQSCTSGESDLDDSGSVNVLDGIVLTNAFGTDNADADQNCDGVVNVSDIRRWTGYW